MTDPACICKNLSESSEGTIHFERNPECPVHGDESDWYSKPNFLNKIEWYASTNKHVLFRYSNGYDFLELNPKFVLECVKEARLRLRMHKLGIEEVTPLEKLALLVLDEASKCF